MAGHSHSWLLTAFKAVDRVSKWAVLRRFHSWRNGVHLSVVAYDGTQYGTVVASAQHRLGCARLSTSDPLSDRWAQARQWRGLGRQPHSKKI